MSDGIVRLPEGLSTDGTLLSRYLAAVLDALVVAVPFILFQMEVLPPRTPDAWMRFRLGLLNLFIGFAYGSIMEASAWRATLGKRAMGLRICNFAGERVTPLQATGRNLAKAGANMLFIAFPPVIWLLLSLGWLATQLIVMHRSPAHQAIHDYLASTLVTAPEEMSELHIS